MNNNGQVEKTMTLWRLCNRVTKGQTRAEAELEEKKETGSCRSQIKGRRTCKEEAKGVQVSEVYYDVS